MFRTMREILQICVFALLINLVIGGAYPPLQSVIQVDECDKAVAVIVHEPQTEVDQASLHPAGSLFEKTTYGELARQASQNMVDALTKRGIAVFKVHEVLAKADKKFLLELAMKALRYELSITGSRRNQEKLTYYLSDEYKRQILEVLPVANLVKIILGRHVVVLSESAQNTAIQVDYVAERPLGNLVFTRDQQIITAKGLIIAHLESPQREPETDIMELVFNILEVPVIGKIPPSESLEGGDFIPFGEELCFIGVGLRTTRGAVDYLMSHDLFGTKKVALVLDEFDKHQDRMHLDTYFNIVDKQHVFYLETLAGIESPLRRMVYEYEKIDGIYQLSQAGVEMTEYLTALGLNIIYVTHEQQLGYAINFVGMGSGDIIAISHDTVDLIKQSTSNATVEYIEYDGIKRMYGAAHCSTQVFRAPNTYVPPVKSTEQVSDEPLDFEAITREIQ